MARDGGETVFGMNNRNFLTGSYTTQKNVAVKSYLCKRTPIGKHTMSASFPPTSLIIDRAEKYQSRNNQSFALLPTLPPSLALSPLPIPARVQYGGVRNDRIANYKSKPPRPPARLQKSKFHDLRFSASLPVGLTDKNVILPVKADLAPVIVR